MKIWQPYKLSFEQGCALGFIPDRSGKIYDHKYHIERFLLWIRLKKWNGYRYKFLPHLTNENL